MNFLASLEKRSKLLWIVVGFALIGAIGFFDYLTGYEFAISVFYLIPISLVTWLVSWRLGIGASLVSALVWLITDLAAGKAYSLPVIYVWNTLIVVLLLSELRKALEQERELAQTDYLTGAVNSRFFYDLVQMEINRSQRFEHPFALAYFDIDNFKVVNDRFGHNTCDQVLRVVVDQARMNMRQTDVVARLSGDEFALLLPETNQGAAHVVLSKIQSGILEGMQQSHWSVTVSIGVLTCTKPSNSAGELIGLVDELMYSAKRGGRNAIKYATYAG
jgi:diguanylate cyclase (GGDEF)-like protein